jgi:hypothetical protein
MYVRTPNPWGFNPLLREQLTKAVPTLRTPYQVRRIAFLGEPSGTRSAGERIREQHFGYVLKILAGRSLWQTYINKNLAVARKNLPKRPFLVVTRSEFDKTLITLKRPESAHLPGITDKRTGVITMIEYFGGSSNATYLGAALHEAVHLVSHPPGRSSSGESTSSKNLEEGLHEGLVECVTENILTTQGFTLAKGKLRGHEDRIPVAKAMVNRFGVPLFARLLFEGDFQHFIPQMVLTYSSPGWEEIKSLTTANKPKLAIDSMKKWEAIQQRIRLGRWAGEVFPITGFIRSLSRR